MTCTFAKYSDIFGKPKEGAHSIRIANIAVVDVISTILLSCAIAYTKKYNFFIVFLIIFLIGIILHRLFCVNTTINKLFFGDVKV